MPKEGGRLEVAGNSTLDRLRRIVATAGSRRISDSELADLLGFNGHLITAPPAGITPFPRTWLSPGLGDQLIERYRTRTAAALELVAAHELTEWMGLWRVEHEGRDPFPDWRARWLDVLARMTKEVVMASPAVTTSRRGSLPPASPSNGGRRRSREPEPTFGSRLVVLRQRAGLSQTALAAKLETSPGVVRNWEHDRTFPQPYRLTRLCQVLRCTRRELLG